jgi:hypothetical protein
VDVGQLAQDGQLSRKIRIVGLDAEEEKREREQRRKDEREAKRQAERDRLSRLGY